MPAPDEAQGAWNVYFDPGKGRSIDEETLTMSRPWLHTIPDRKSRSIRTDRGGRRAASRHHVLPDLGSSRLETGPCSASPARPTTKSSRPTVRSR